MKIYRLGIVLAAALSACNGLDQPFTAGNATGSCQYTTTDGYDYCEDFLGSEYNQSIAQNTCTTGNGTWSADACSQSAALGICAIPIGNNDAQNIQYTYYVSHGSGAPASTLTVETACGVAGGVFTAK